ncbi:MAG TPA: carbonic anhydrase family protein [Rhizomicrobium sp.]|nr:carbonic anhydrase family protein [Rhizomicrobium sp.]
MHPGHDCCPLDPAHTRRHLLKCTIGLGALTGVGLGLPTLSFAASLTKGERDRLTPDEVIAHLKQGNDRFRSGKMLPHDYLAQKRATAAGQYPAAAILGCIDSRAPAEVIFDTEIGEVFNARVAGNVANDDLVGSIEFACALSGAKLVVVMGHTACGAIKGAIDSAKLGNLTGLLEKIKPAVAATQFQGERSSKNDVFVDAVAVTNVRRTVEEIRRTSPVLTGLEKDAKIKLVGAMYHLVGGRVEFL